jgi:hypothetical protein
MPAYRSTETRFIQPASQPVPGAPAQGERVNTEGLQVLKHWGQLRPLPAELVMSALGQAGRQYFRWRGRLPDGVEPEPGWELRAVGRRLRVVVAANNSGRLWTLDLEQL